MPRGSNPLNKMQRLFVVEYLKDHNATQSAIRAGYSPKTAGIQGHKLLKVDKIQKTISNVMEQQVQEVAVDAKWVLLEAVDLYKECRLEGDRTAANKSLDTVGKHIDVKAWDKDVNLNASDSLLEVLEAARLRAMETKD